MTLDRRSFLRAGAAAGAAALVLPGWLARAFAQDHGAGTGRELTTSLATFSAAYRDAQRLGKPLLVLVVPSDEGQKWTRARAFGELLNGGPDAALADLALAHVVCAEMSAVRALVPQAPTNEPTMVLIEPDRVPASATAIDVALPEPPQQRGRTDDGVDARIAALSSALHRALAPDPATLAERSRVARAHVDGRTLAAIDSALQASAHPTAAPWSDARIVDGAAAVIALAASTASPAVARALHEALAKAAIQRLRLTRVPGSVWANDASCGIEIEGSSEQNMMDCGMGSVSPRSARFLYFYTRPY